MSGTGPSPEQQRYARILDGGMKAGLALLVAGFAAYVFEWVPPLVSFEVLPRLWTLPASDYLRESGMPSGWGWLRLLDRGDVLSLAGIALLSGISVPGLLALVPAYAARRDRAYLGIALALACVLALAASGVLGAH